MFWRDRGTAFWKDRVRGAYLGDQDLARRLLAEWYGHEFPNECTIDFVDCRNFHGTGFGHVGLHPDYQQEYLVKQDNAWALWRLCEDFCDRHGAYPLNFDEAKPTLQRVFIFYCNAGEHRSVAFAALAGDMWQKLYGAEVRSNLCQTHF